MGKQVGKKELLASLGQKEETPEPVVPFVPPEFSDPPAVDPIDELVNNASVDPLKAVTDDALAGLTSAAIPMVAPEPKVEEPPKMLKTDGIPRIMVNANALAHLATVHVMGNPAQSSGENEKRMLGLLVDAKTQTEINDFWEFLKQLHAKNVGG